ncbi:MAG: hypothetical protein HQ523_13830 [Lentisphaerae bacterium]|nr:hypothetical protein [Lentisphaerota bacterium]
MKRIGVFGCKSTTLFLLESLQRVAEIDCVITISPDKGKAHQVADYSDIAPFCHNQGITCYSANRYDLKDEQDVDTFKTLQLDIAFVIGWQRLIPTEVLQTFSIGVFGMHGSTDDLPVGRGRSPMNWALIEQRKHFFTNIFRYDPGIDSGDILDTFVFSIQPDDTGETMHYKNVLAMKTLILRNIDQLSNGNMSLKKQKNSAPTYYPKRSPNDGLIDWNRDIFQLDAFIRAVTSPFDGAFSFINGEKVVIWRASIFETDLVEFGYRDEPFGTVVEVYPSRKFLVRCRGGLLIAHDYGGEVNIERGSLLHSPQEDLKRFKLNRYGYHDLEEA